MKPFVFDSTPLIYLGKAKVLSLLPSLSKRNIIPQSVYDEVVIQGKQKGALDAVYIESLIPKVLVVMEARSKIKSLENNPNLEKGEIDVLSIAKDLPGIAILDDLAARSAADVEGIEKGGSIYLLFSLLRKKVIRKEQCRKIIEEMLFNGWRCSTEMYALILRELER